MKKLMDKPYKTIVYLMPILIFTMLMSKGYVNYTKNQLSTPQDVEIKHEIVKTESISEDKNLVIQRKRSKPLSRGYMPVKKLSQRELIDSYILEISSKYHMDPFLIKSVIQQESEYNPKARNGKCLGLMQVSSRWHRDRADRLGVNDFYDPYGNILLGVDYLSELLEKYEDPRLVLMLYNMDHKTAFRMYKNGQISNYARTIIARAEQYRKGE